MFKKLFSLLLVISCCIFASSHAYAFDKIPTVQNDHDSLSAIKSAFPIYDTYHPFSEYSSSAKELEIKAQQVILSLNDDLANTNKAIEELNQLSDTSKVDAQIESLKQQGIRPSRAECARPFEIQRAAIDLYELTVRTSLDISFAEASTLQEDLLKPGSDVLLEDGTFISAPKDSEDANYKLFDHSSEIVGVHPQIEVSDSSIDTQAHEPAKIVEKDKKGIEPAFRLNFFYVALGILGIFALAIAVIAFKKYLDDRRSN